MSPARLALALAIAASFAPAGLGQDSLPVPSPDAITAPPSPSAGNVPAAAPVSFLIETIRVEGVRGGSTKIVVSETLLSPGTPYTEAQLREALHRVERLPFVVEADFSLRRGTERGRFELVITVTPTWPAFFGGTLDLVRQGLDEGSWESGAITEAGGRVFVGGQSEITGTLQLVSPLTQWYGLYEDSDFAFDVAYRHHDLFGRHVVGTLFLREPTSVGRYSGPSLDREAGTSLAVPLSRVSAVNLDFDVGWSRWRACAEPCPSLAESRATKYEGGASWRRDTTDDPFAPQQGARLEAGLTYANSSSRFAWDAEPSEPNRPRVTSVHTSSGDSVGSILSGRQYWSIASWGALGLGGTLGVSRSWGDLSEQDGEEVWTGTVSGTAVNSTVEAELLGRPRVIGLGATQLWWVVRASARGAWSWADWDPAMNTLAVAESRFAWGRLSVGVAARGRWGIARFELSYEHVFPGHLEYQ